MKISCPRESVYIPLIAFLVVCGVGEVMETFDSHMVLSRVDLPDDGLPIMATDAHFMAKIIYILGCASKVVIGCN